MSTSFSSVPRHFRDNATRLAKQRDVPVWEVYEAAVRALETDMAAGQAVEWPATRRIKQPPYGVRLPAETLEFIRLTSDRHRVSRTAVFMAALARYLTREGIPTGYGG